MKQYEIGKPVQHYPGSISVGIHVEGYWSGSTITLDIKTGYWANGGTDVSISYGSGGHESGYDDVQRARNFGAAILAAADLAEEYRKHPPARHAEVGDLGLEFFKDEDEVYRLRAAA